MRQPLVVIVPHQLTREEARARIEGGIGQVRQQLAPFARTIEDRWIEDRMEFSLTAVGQNVSGRIDVMDEAVRIEVDLPWLLRFLGERLQKRIGKQGRLMLEEKT